MLSGLKNKNVKLHNVKKHPERMLFYIMLYYFI